jgi:3-oxoacyl-[acyl-carrier protein] reductase
MYVNSGIGASIATYLARDGANVIINYNASLIEANEVVNVIRQSGGQAQAIKANMTLSNEVDHLFNETIRLFGRIDIVIANTGIFVDEMKPISLTAEADFDKLINGNLRSAFLTYRAAAKLIQPNGRIIGIGSNAYHGMSCLCYAATRFPHLWLI